MRKGVALAAFALVASATIAGAQTSSGADSVLPNRNSMNPAARHAKPIPRDIGTNVPGATGVNPYTGKSVGVPLQPNDLGSPTQNEREH